MWIAGLVNGTGTMTSDNTVFRTGARSLKLAVGVGAGNAFARASNVLADTGTQCSFDFQLAGLPPTVDANLVQGFPVTLGQNEFAITVTPSGVLRLATVSATAGTGSTVLAPNKWYRLCVSYFVTTSTKFQYVLYLQDLSTGVITTECMSNTGTLPRTGALNIAIGLTQSQWGNSKTIWIDNAYISIGGASSVSQPDTGDVEVTYKRTLTNGLVNGFTTQIGVGGSGYGTGHAPQVNEQPLSQTNGWSMVGAGAAVSETYNVEAIEVGNIDLRDYPIVDWGSWVFAKSAASETAQQIVGGASSSIALTSTATMFQKYAGSTTYPAGLGTDVGLITDTSLTTVSLYEAGVLIAFRRIAPTTSLKPPIVPDFPVPTPSIGQRESTGVPDLRALAGIGAAGRTAGRWAGQALMLSPVTAIIRMGMIRAFASERPESLVLRALARERVRAQAPPPTKQIGFAQVVRPTPRQHITAANLEQQAEELTLLLTALLNGQPMVLHPEKQARKRRRFTQRELNQQAEELTILLLALSDQA